MNDDGNADGRSSLEVGDAFRDLVCDLLRTQYPDASREHRLKHSKVDIVFTKHEFGADIRYGVECKDYAQPLTKSYVSKEIWTIYQPLLNSKDLDRVLVVSRRPMGADAQAFFDSWAGASHRTYEELAESLMGLRPYLLMLSSLPATEASEYIDARIEDQPGRAADLAGEWIDKEGAPALAILGGYGQGKTSFARHLAAVYAKRHLQDPTARMPVLLHLGEVVHETQLEGLFGKQFTARYPAAGYQFRTLEHLNAAGRLLIILDGFDEMKHAMTAADFQANFREFNRLLVGRAKVLLLGRPNALPSNERDLVFRGLSTVGDQAVASANYAPWTEWRLALFDEGEARRLLTSTLGLMQQRHASAGRFTYAPEFATARVDEVFKLVPADLLRRPVHIHLIAELAANPGFDLRGFNLFKLYDHFIRQMVERDTVQKQARRPIPLEARLKFQRELAWWAWRRPGASQGCFFRHEVPLSLLKDLPEGNAADKEGQRNEYIVSTLTEEKETGVLFFAHRSFQEFLVAERLRLTPTSPAAHEEYSLYLTQDVVDFLKQAPDDAFICDWYDSLQGASGQIEMGYLSFMASFPVLMKHIRETTLAGPAHQLDAWTVSILNLAAQSNTAGAVDASTLQRLMGEVVRKGQSDAAAMSALGMLEHYNRRLEPAILVEIVAAVLERCLRASRSDGPSLVVPKHAADFATQWLSSAVRRVLPAAGKVTAATLEFDLNVFEQHCAKELHPQGATGIPQNPFGKPFREGALVPVAVETSKVYAAIDGDVRKQHEVFLSSKRPTFNATSVDERRHSSHTRYRS